MHLEYRTGYVPMRIVARMDEPIGYLDDLLHIDAAISYGVYHDLDIATRRTIPPIQTTDWPVDLTLPLSSWWVDYDAELHGEVDPRLMKRRRTGKNGTAPQLWGWCASAANDTAWEARSKCEVRKKPALGEMRRYTDAKNHNLGTGFMKAYDLAIPTVLAREVAWFSHGDPEHVRHLLSEYVPALGKKRNIGNGTVREWVVEPCDVDRSVVVDGKAARRLPAGVPDGTPRHGTIRPPYYWTAGRSVMAVEPC